MNMLRACLLSLWLVGATGCCSNCSAQQPGESTLADTLELLGWTRERAALLANQDSLTGADRRNLLRLALRLERFEERLREDARAQAVAPLRPVLAPVTVELVEVISLDPKRSSRVGAEDYAVCQIDIDGAPAVAIAPRAPRAWTDGGVLPQPAQMLALEAREATKGAPGFYAVVDWDWRPTAPDYPTVNFGETALGGLGVDVAELENVVDGGPLTARDSESFYAILGAMRQTGANQLTRFARSNFSRYAAQWNGDAALRAGAELAAEARRVIDLERYPIAPLFNDAVAQRGELYVLDGSVRRAVRISATPAGADPAHSLAARHGVDHYYELEVFTPDSRNLPVMFCALELPEGFPLGDNIQQRVRIAGFSLKRWAYRTRQTDDGEDKPQLAPILIGRAPIALAPASDANAQRLGLAAGAAFVVLLAGLWLFMWRAHLSDAAFEAGTLDRLHASRTGVDAAKLAELDAGASDRQ